MTADLLTKPTVSRRFIPALCASALFLCVFALYLYAHESDGGWGDGPDFVVCSYFLGVPHPTGYPLFAILGKAATFVPVGTIAFRVGLLSTCAGALGVAFLFFTILQFIKNVPFAFSLAFVFGISFLLISQTVTVEVYSLNFLFMTILSLLILQNRDIRHAFTFFLVAAIGLGNHGTLVFATIILGILPLSYSLKSRLARSSVLVIALIMLIGLFSYASLPLFAARGFQFIWNNPVNIKDFYQLLSGSDFWGGMFQINIIIDSIRHISIYDQFLLFPFVYFLPIIFILWSNPRIGEKRSATLFILFLISSFITTIFALSYPTSEKGSFLLLPIATAFICITSISFNKDTNKIAVLIGRIGMAIAGIIMCSLALMMLQTMGVDQFHIRDASSNKYSRMMFKNSERDALIFVDHVADDAVYAPVYAQSVENMRPDTFIFHRMLLAFPWYMDAMRARAEVAAAAAKIPRINPDAEANRIYEVTEDEKRRRESGAFANTIAIDAQTVLLLNSNLTRIPVYFNLPELFLRSSFSEKYDIAPTGVLFQAGRNTAGAPIPKMTRSSSRTYWELMRLVYMDQGRFFLLASQKDNVYDSKKSLKKAIKAFRTSLRFGSDCRVYSILETLYRSLDDKQNADKYKSLMASDFCIGDPGPI